METIPYIFLDFQIGDKVLCIDDNTKSKTLEKGKIYTIKEIIAIEKGDEIRELITVEEIELPPKIGFFADKFEKVIIGYDDKLLLTNTVKKAILQANIEAQNLKCSCVLPTHLFLSLLDDNWDLRIAFKLSNIDNKKLKLDLIEAIKKYEGKI